MWAELSDLFVNNRHGGNDSVWLLRHRRPCSFPFAFSLGSLTLTKPAAMLWGHSSVHVERSVWWGTEAFCQQPCDDHPGSGSCQSQSSPQPCVQALERLWPVWDHKCDCFKLLSFGVICYIYWYIDHEYTNLKFSSSGLNPYSKAHSLNSVLTTKICKKKIAHGHKISVLRGYSVISPLWKVVLFINCFKFVLHLSNVRICIFNI